MRKAKPGKQILYPGAEVDDDAPSERRLRVQPFRLDEPERLTSGLVFSSPHSGRTYFREFVEMARLSGVALRASEDAFVDALFGACVGAGAPLIAAIAPRAFVDLNRAEDDLDQDVVQGVGGRPRTARAVAGLGVIPRVVSEDAPIYAKKVPLAEARARIAHWHRPYHQRLHALLERARRRFGAALLVDCHSMPSSVSSGLSGHVAGGADIVLGDRFGGACCARYVDAVEAALVDQGFTVSRNAPFAGGYITERYGRPSIGVHAIQIEVDRGLYLDEAAVAPSAGFDGVSARLSRAARQIAALIGERSTPGALAAE